METELSAALKGRYKLGIAADRARMDAATARRRARLEAWVDEQVRALGKKKGKKGEAEQRFWGEIVGEAAYTWLNRLVYLKLLEGHGLRKQAVLTGGRGSSGFRDFQELAPELCEDVGAGYACLLRLVFDELALDLPGLFGRGGLAELVPMPAATLMAVVEALDGEALASCWGDDMTLGWVYQYWNDPEREALDAKLNDGGKVERHEIASKTQMFTERYMVDWLLQNSLGPMWLAMCKKHGWTAACERDGVLGGLEARRVDWRAKREAGEVELTELMPLHSDAERRWAYYVPQPIPDDAVESAPESVREIRLLDPAVGSGHFLVVAFDLLVALYREEAEHRGEVGEEQWSDRAIVERILGWNLHGVDLDRRAVQIAAAALWLKAQRVSPEARPERLGLVAADLKLGSLPKDDAGLVELRKVVEQETGIPGALTDRVITALEGADYLGSLLKVGDVLDEVVAEHDLSRAQPEQGSLLGGQAFAPEQKRIPISVEEGKRRLVAKLEAFLASHGGGEDLGLRLRGEQLAAGVRFLRTVREGAFDVVVGNPPYQGTSKMADAGYVKKEYPRGKADLFAAFLERGLALVREGGTSALLTMRNWMFIKQYAGLREWLLEGADLRALGDVDRGGFEDIPDEVVSVVISVFRRAKPGAAVSVALQPTPLDDTSRDSERTRRKRSATLCHEGRYEFEPAALKVVPEWPVVYWWDEEFLARYDAAPKLGEIAPARQGMATADNTRFLRAPPELTQQHDRFSQAVDVIRLLLKPWVPYVKGAEGRAWFEPLTEVVRWDSNALEIKLMERDGKQASRPQNEQYYFRPGVAFSSTGAACRARLHRYPSVFDIKGQSVFGDDPEQICCVMNSSLSASVLSGLNPSISFQVGDAMRLPFVPVKHVDGIKSVLESAFTTHESHREPSVEFLHPGPSPWRHAQAWAQLAVDRPENTPLPDYIEQLDPEPPTDHISYALGVALGRFAADNTGILDPATADLTHALPNGTLFLDGTLPPSSTADSLGHPSATLLHQSWKTHASAIDTKRKNLRDYLRLDFFDIHRSMYENRPIHWPLSSERKTFVAWINIHRWHAGTLRSLIADHLRPALQRLHGQIEDLKATMASGDSKAAAKADKDHVRTTKHADELQAFIDALSECAERGPPPPDPKTPPREADAPYDPDLDDGVMINSSALYPVLQPQWKDPKKWWKELVLAKGRKDYDWSHLAARYFPTRVDDKSKSDPSLGVAHKCFWKYHPARAYAWELRLQDEIAPDFTIDEPGSDAARTAFLRDHPDEAAEIRTKEHKRREKKRDKEQKQREQNHFDPAPTDAQPPKAAAK